MTRPADTRTRIETEAVRLFAEKGVGETSIKDIAQAAGVAQGALYRHYPSKEALVRGLFADNYTAFAGVLDRAQAQGRDTRGKLARMIRCIAEFFDREPALFGFLLFAQHDGIKHLPKDAPNPLEVLRRVLADGRRRREIRAIDPDEAAAQVLGPILQTATFVIYGRLKGPLTRYADTLEDAAWRILAPDRPISKKPA